MSLDAGVRRRLAGFLAEVAERMGWDEEATSRLCSAGEEALMSLVDRDQSESGLRRLRVAARSDGPDAVLDFLAAPRGVNLEDQLALIRANAPPADEREISLRLLGHYASSIRHRHYGASDLLTVAVKGTGGR